MGGVFAKPISGYLVSSIYILTIVGGSIFVLALFPKCEFCDRGVFSQPKELNENFKNRKFFVGWSSLLLDIVFHKPKVCMNCGESLFKHNRLNKKTKTDI